jgi:hypothetical protein
MFLADRFKALLPELEVETIIVSPSAREGSHSASCRLVRDHGGGVYAAYTQGIECASGTYIWLIGDDDFPLDGARAFATHILHGAADIVAAPVIFSDGRVYRQHSNPLALLLRNWCQQGVLYRKSVLQRYRFYKRLKVQADHFANVKMNADRTINKVFISTPVCVFGLHGLSSRQKDEPFRKLRPQLAQRTLRLPERIVFFIWNSAANLRRLVNRKNG